MKKTLQINIGGFFFTIEEDAYHKLSNYLNALKSYFSSYESCDEIVQDIEARIAEKFFEKQPQNGIIENEDVDKIIASMGSVSDFEALKEDEDLQSEKVYEQNNGQQNRQTQTVGGLYRDGKRKALGGVLAGIAHKYNFDVVWARILFLVFALGLIGEGVGPFMILLYVIAWIVVPVRNDLEESPTVRKFYRNPEDKVIGGVASGLASYLKMDVKILRIIFVISGFLVIGIILYLLFWIVAPVAHSVTQKLQLEGQAVTIQNIEKSVKSKEAPQEASRESTLSKILLFPFRLIGVVFTFLGTLIRPLGSVLKFFAGLILLMIGISFVFSALVGLGAFFGVQNSMDWLATDSLEFNRIIQEIPALGVIFAFFAIFVPGVALTIAGIMLMINKALGNRNFWAALLVLWLTGIVGVTAIGTKYSLNFAKRENIETSQSYSFAGQDVIVFDATNTSEYSNFSFRPGFNIASTSLKDVYVNINLKSNGPNSVKARQFAQNIRYKMEKKGDALVFDKNYTLPEGDPFRDQSVRLSLEVPKGVKFRFTEKFLDSFGYPYDFELDDRTDHSGENIFIYDENNKLKCLNCPESDPYEKIEDDFNYNSFTDEFDRWENRSFNKSLTTAAFDGIFIKQNFRVILVKADSVTARAYSDYEGNLNEIKTKLNGKTLEIEYQDPFKEYNEVTYLYLTAPSIASVKLQDESSLKMYGFDNLNKLSVTVEDKSKAAIHTDSKSMDLSVSNQSNVLLQGQIEDLNAKVSNRSILKAQKARINSAKVNATASSVAEMPKLKNKNFIAEQDSAIKEEN
jgi:phage shock protein PspC (stress-responsive transcriptional regulator)